MDAFLEPYWNLDQVKAWAETRDPELVRFATASLEQGAPKSTAQIGICSIQRATKVKLDGRDVAAELWAASGLTPRILPYDIPPQVVLAWVRAQAEGNPFVFFSKDLVAHKTETDGPSEILAHREEFPTITYLLILFRADRLRAIGFLSGNPRAYEFSSLDWAGLEIAVCGDPPRLGVRRIGSARGETGFENVCVRREHVLREFPSEPPPAAAADLEAILREALRDNPKLTQTEAEKIAPERGAVEPREKIRALFKHLGGSSKPGPRGPRKNRATPSA